MSEEMSIESGIDQVNSEPSPSIAPDAPVDAPADLKQELKQAAKDGASQEEMKQMIKEYELKVNGKVKKVKFNPNDDKAVIKALQMQEAGQLAMQDQAEFKKMVTQALLEGKQNPKKFLQEHLGLDPQQILEQWLEEEIEHRKKSPEQLEKEKIQKELEEYRTKLKKVEEEKEVEKMSRLEQQAAADLDKEILEALGKDKELPRSRKTVRRIVDAMLWAMTPAEEGGGGYPDVKVGDVLPAVKAEIRNELNEFMSELPEEAFETYLGKNNIERMRKKRLAAMKQAPVTVDTKQVAPKSEEQSKQEKLDARDFFRKLSRGQ